MIRKINEYAKFLESQNEIKEYILEDAIKSFLAPYLIDDMEYTLDSDGSTLLLYIPKDNLKFNIEDNTAPEWNILKLKFQEFCTNNDLCDFEVTTTSDYTQLVFSAVADMR